MKICLPSRLKIAPVGYQPVGTKPFTTLRPPLLTSTTAMALESALETSSVCPSGDSASEFGVEVRGALGYRLIEICSIGWPEKVSNTQTDELLPQATKSRLPSCESTSAFGCSSGAELLEQDHRRQHVDLHARSAPERHVQHASVGRHHAAVGLGRQRHGLRHLARRQVDRRHALREDARDEQRLAVRADGEAAREALAGDRGQRERPRARDRAVRVVELLNVVLPRTGGIEPGAVGMPGEAEPRVVERHRALHRPARDVDDGERRPRQPVAGDDQVARVGCLDQIQRHVADAHVLAGGLNAPAVGKQRRAVGHGAGERGRGRRRLRACPERAPTGGGEHRDGQNRAKVDRRDMALTGWTRRLTEGKLRGPQRKRATVSSWGSDLTEKDID